MTINLQIIWSFSASRASFKIRAACSILFITRKYHTGRVDDELNRRDQRFVLVMIEFIRGHKYGSAPVLDHERPLFGNPYSFTFLLFLSGGRSDLLVRCGSRQQIATLPKKMRAVAEWDKILKDETSDDELPPPPLNPEMLRAFAATSDENALPEDWKRAHQDLCTRFNDGASSTHPISQTPLASILDSQTTHLQSPDASERPPA